MTSAYVLNGPNLNLLGMREPEIYGTATLADVERSCRGRGERAGLELWSSARPTARASSSIGSRRPAQLSRPATLLASVLNAAAYTHTSIALHDAIAGSGARVIEVHISNVYSREPFRHLSYVSPVAAGIIVGFGVAGYPLALRALAP